MKKILNQLLKYATCIFCISILLAYLAYSHEIKNYRNHLGNSIGGQKLDSIKNGNYNYLFVGSSTIYRHLNPQIFDSLIPEAKSFNMGIPTQMPPISIEYANELLLQIAKKNDVVVFLELRPLINLNSNYNHYHYLRNQNFNQVKSVIGLSFVTGNGKKNSFDYLASYSYKFLGFGLIQRVYDIFNKNKYEDIPVHSQTVRNWNLGHVSFPVLSETTLDSNNYNSKQLRHYQQLRKLFTTSNYSDLDIKNFFDNVQKTVIPSSYSDFYVKNIDRLKKNCKEVYLIVPPRIFPNPILRGLVENLRAKNFVVFDYSVPTEHPDYYMNDVSFDLFHMNEIGADKFTKRFALDFNNFLNNNEKNK